MRDSDAQDHERPQTKYGQAAQIDSAEGRPGELLRFPPSRADAVKLGLIEFHILYSTRIFKPKKECPRVSGRKIGKSGTTDQFSRHFSPSLIR
jgi:hypothetical protein